MKLIKHERCEGLSRYEPKCLVLRIYSLRCALGYSIEYRPLWCPTEPCPKPMTRKQLAECKQKGKA